MGQAAVAGTPFGGWASLEQHYFLQKVKLGEGSFGTVWRAVDRRTNEVVAIKQLDKGSLPRRGVKREHIEREVAMMKACEHVNITKLFGTFEDEARIYMALEYCEGGDFGDKVKERGLSLEESEVAEWMRQICSAIAALHHKCICHRDIKPDNFMVSGHGASQQLKLADFGLAVYLPMGRMLQEKCGTPAFMAPEQHGLPKNSPGYGFPADVWAAGVAMYMVMFGGRHPFLTDRGMLDEKSLLQGNLDFREGDRNRWLGFDLGPTSLRFSDAARDLCSRMVCPNPGKRYKAEDCLRVPWITGGRPMPPQPMNGRAPSGERQLQAPGGYSSVPAPPRTARQPSPSPAVANGRPPPVPGQWNQAAPVMGHPLPPPMPPQRNANEPISGVDGPVQQEKRDIQRSNTKKFSDMPQEQRQYHGQPNGARSGTLPAGTKCRYNSGKFGWMESVVLRLNPDGTYDLEHKPGAAADKIAPILSSTMVDAWPVGALAMYHSTSINTWLPAVVTAFNESNKTYNLDVRDHADVDRIRARVERRSGSRSPADAQGGEQAGRKPPQPQLPATLADPCRSGAPPPASTPAAGGGYPAGMQGVGGGYPGEQPRAGSKEVRDGSKEAPLNLNDLKGQPALSREATRPFGSGRDRGRSGQPGVQVTGMHCMSPEHGLMRLEAFSPADNSVTAVVVNSVPELRVQVQERRVHAPDEPFHAWVEGTKVWYDSPSTGVHLPAVVLVFNGKLGKYNLDVRDYATPDRIKPRFAEA